MITYDTLRRIEQEEKGSAKLVQLPERFLQEVREYMEKKEEITKEKGDKWELSTAKQRFSDIMDIRERKIVSFALSFVRSGSFPASMLPEEKELFEGIAAMIKEHQGRREMAMNGERPALKAVAFLQDIPQFVGIDMGCYGPYSKGDIASVPEANAKVLVEKGAAELAESGS